MAVEDFGIFPRVLAEQVAAYMRRVGWMGKGGVDFQPPYTRAFLARDDISQGHIVSFQDTVDAFYHRDADENIRRFKNHALEEAGYAASDTNLTNLRKLTWGVSISDVSTDQCGIAIVNGPACVECALGTATATNVGNFIVPWTTKDKQGLAEIRPYGIGRCIEDEPGTAGWRWVMMGQCKWECIGKTDGAHGKGATQNVNVHFGTTKGSETATGLTQSCYNRWADIDSGKWIRFWFDYEGAELVNGEC